MRQSGSLPATPVRSLLSLLADGGRTAALAALHQRGVDVSGGTRVLLFEPNPRNGSLLATSGYGLDLLPSDPWHLSSAEQALIAEAFARGAALAVQDVQRQMPALHARMATRAAILVPLARRRQRVGLLTIGLEGDAAEAASAVDASEVGAAFVLALELARLRQREEMEREVRRLLDTFTEAVAATLDVAQALAPLCAAASRLFAADRMAVWLHDRESRQLVLRATSDLRGSGVQVVRADDPLAPAASALRAARAGLAGEQDASTSVLTVPLRGCRRALGTIVVEGVRVEPGDEINLLDRADELGRQLASAVETVQLLDAVRGAGRPQA